MTNEKRKKHKRRHERRKGKEKKEDDAGLEEEGENVGSKRKENPACKRHDNAAT